MTILATDGPEIDFDKINQNYSLATNTDAYDSRSKQDEGVKTEPTDIQKARQYILQRMQLEPEAEELESEIKRQEKLKQMQGVVQKISQKKQESARERITRIEKELKQLASTLEEVSCFIYQTKDKSDILGELNQAIAELKVKDLSASLP